MKQFINEANYTGKLYDFKNLEKKVSKASKTEYISGTLMIALDEKCENVISHRINYCAKLTKSGNVSKSYTFLEGILATKKTVLNVGYDNAEFITVFRASFGVNDYYGKTMDKETGKYPLNSKTSISGGYPGESSKSEFNNLFDIDMVVLKKNIIPENTVNKVPMHLELEGCTFSFSNEIIPVKLNVYMEDGINYFNSQDISNENPMITRLQGYTFNRTIAQEQPEANGAFGGQSKAQTKDKHFTENIVTWAQQHPYTFGDPKVITPDELAKAIADRNLALAEKEKEHIDNMEKQDANAFNNAGIVNPGIPAMGSMNPSAEAVGTGVNETSLPFDL